MADHSVNEKQRERVRVLKESDNRKGGYILYWMHASPRSRTNHALEFAIHLANREGVPLLSAFALTDEFPEANLRHYWFLAQGLAELIEELEERGIGFLLLKGHPPAAAAYLAAEAAAVVVDTGYLKVQRRWRRELLDRLDKRVYAVEANVVVPVETASEKEQYSAATLRPRINRHLHRFLKPIDELDLERESSASEKLAPELPGTVETGGKTWEITRFDRVGLESPERLMEVLSGLDGSVRPVDWIRGGTREAEKRLESFIRDRLDDYPEARNDPSLEGQSNLSPYLHFGQISPVRIALAVQEAGGEGVGAYLEELIVRRELSMNFCRYNDNYDSYDALPEWARKSLSEHLSDRRAVVYDLETLEAGRTDDPYWNASQLEMVQSGKMHGYMRMYWGKKILEWSESPRDAFANALYLNNKYELDGRDPNGFTGVAWCFGKHDRGWPERQVFGKVRYMNANGLRRKFKGIDAYVERWSS